MKYDVWHAKKPNFGFGNKPEFPEDYEMVAEVECKDIEDVFRATNHIDSNWTKNPEVIQCRVKPCRSTSVGDVVVDEDGKEFYCNMVGWNRR